MSKTRHASNKADPQLSLPDLPPVPWNNFGGEAPTQLPSPNDSLPEADVIIVTWVKAEWAAMQQVFIDSETPMPYSARTTSYWDNWNKYDWDMPSTKGTNDWDFWGYYRLVEVRGKKILLFKSNTHLVWPGLSYLEQMTNQLLDACKPSLLLSIGTAGGAELEDHEGTVRIVSSAKLYDSQHPDDPSKWPTYSCDWKASTQFIGNDAFMGSLNPIPTTQADLESLASQFDGGKYPLSTLDANGLCFGDPAVKLYDMSGDKQSLVTTPAFVVANNAPNSPFRDMACVEMDDAILGKVCQDRGTLFGSARNVSDPVQNYELPVSVQGDWGDLIYRTYGLYTSYNGALAAWAAV